MTIFHTIRTDDEVEDAVVATLQHWLPTYMAEVERQRGLQAGYYARPTDGSFTVKTDFDSWPADILPLVMIVSQGIDDDPQREGRGRYRGTFPVGVINICESTDDVETRRYAFRMGAAIRALLLHHQSLDHQLDDSVRGVDFIGSRNNELPVEGERTVRAYRQLFEISVSDIVTRPGGPTDPDPQLDPNAPYPDDPTVDPNAATVDMDLVGWQSELP